jgi:hypothetical protein
MAGRLTGGCQCGAVRYEIDLPYARAYACHCRDCQRLTASAFSVSMPVDRSALHLTGTLASFDKPTDSGETTTSWFCPTCGTRIFHASTRSPERATLKLGTLDDTSGVRPASHIWVSRKQPWVILDPDVVVYDTQPDDLAAWRATLFS